MAGKRQHYVPKLLQRGFLDGPPGEAERTWLHRRGANARPVGIRDIGVEDWFYSRKWLIPLAPADQDVVGGGLEGEAEAEQALEGGGGRPAAIEAEDELVEVRLQVLRPQAVI